MKTSGIKPSKLICFNKSFLNKYMLNKLSLDVDYFWVENLVNWNIYWEKVMSHSWKAWIVV